MGGALGVAIKFREDQFNVIKDIHGFKEAGYTSNEIQFVAWTNWISWFMHSPDFWIHPDEAKSKVNRNILLESNALKELAQYLIDSKNEEEYHKLKYPVPYGYGIICYDLVNRTVLSSQGYSTPGTFILSTNSTAFVQQLTTLANLSKFNRIASFGCPIFSNTKNRPLEDFLRTNSEYADLINEMDQKKEPYSIIINDEPKYFHGGVKTQRSMSKLFIGPITIRRVLQTCADALVGQHIEEIHQLSHRSQRTIPYLAALSNCWITFKETSHSKLFTVKEIEEPTNLFEAYSRLETINSFLKRNKWRSTIPLNLLDPQKFNSKEETYDMDLELSPLYAH